MLEFFEVEIGVMKKKFGIGIVFEVVERKISEWESDFEIKKVGSAGPYIQLFNLTHAPSPRCALPRQCC